MQEYQRMLINPVHELRDLYRRQVQLRCVRG